MIGVLARLRVLHQGSGRFVVFVRSRSPRYGKEQGSPNKTGSIKGKARQAPG